jgi:hypothetical protein
VQEDPLHLVGFDEIVHKCGYLGCFLNSGTVALGDPVTVTDERLESIPYAVKDRIRWFLGKQNAALAALDLVHALGLPSSSPWSSRGSWPIWGSSGAKA